MNFLFWKKKPEQKNEAFAPYEEIDAKRTSKLGYFFLLLMIIFGVLQGNNFLSALQDSIEEPQRNSSCMEVLARYSDNNNESYYNSYYNYQENGCIFSERETRLSLESVYRTLETSINSVKVADNNISQLENEIESARQSRNQIVSDYQLSLLESIAEAQNTAFNQNYLQSGIITQDEYLQRLQTTLAVTKRNKESLISQITTKVQPYKNAIAQARSEYEKELVINQFLQFLVSLILILPLFIFVWKRYHLAKLNRSEFAVIWGGLVATSGILLAQIILVFIYEILPHEILEKIFTFLAQIKILWALLYWLGFILVPLFFGFLIYLIQKKFYNKQAIMMRAVKNAHCPNCSMKTNVGMNSCPVCGYKLKEQCRSCGAMTMSSGSFCEICGVRNEGQL